MKKVIIFFFFVVTFSNCLDTKFDSDILPYTEQSIAFGYIDSVHGARIFVGKTADIFKKDSNLVKGVTVSLWSDNKLIENLKFYQKNIFITSDSFKTVSNKSYYFKTKTQLSKDTLISDAVKIPQQVKIEKIHYQALHQDGADIYFDILTPQLYAGYLIGYQLFKQDTLLSEDFENNRIFIPYQGRLISNKDFQDGKYAFKLNGIQTSIYFSDIKRTIDADRAKVYIFGLSKETYQSLLTFRTPEPGIGDPFFEPNILPKTVINGYGFLGSYSTTSFEILLK